jgi:hypothetical protein
MAILPLFNDTLDTLKASLRLTGSNETADVQDVIEDGVRAFKVWMIQRGGFALISELQAVVYTDDPASELEARRMAARILEVKHVWAHLLDRLQTMFADASGAAFQEFNDQGVWRQLDGLDKLGLLRLARREIEELYCFVGGAQSIGEVETIQAFDGSTAVTECYYPAGSAWPLIGKFRGNFIDTAISLRFSE